MRKRFKVLAASAVGAVLVVVLAGLGAWFFVLRSDAPSKVSLAGAISSLAAASPSPSAAPSAVPSAFPGGGPGGRDAGGEGGGRGGGGDFGVKAAPSVAAPALPTSAGSTATAGIAGTWTPDPAQQSFVGYRVQEQLRAIGSNTVVGRTPNVTGQAILTSNSVTSATFTADMTTLKSDNSLRDGQLRNQGIQYSTHPTSTFDLSGPLSLPAGLAAGQPVSVTLAGKFTLHGVTKDVSVPAQAQVVNSDLVVVGSFPITFADYQVSKPHGGPVLSLADTAEVELQLILKRS